MEIVNWPLIGQMMQIPATRPNDPNAPNLQKHHARSVPNARLPAHDHMNDEPGAENHGDVEERCGES